MSDLPYFPFFPSDWSLETKRLTLFEKGVLIELLCEMHESLERGKLIQNGGPLPIERLTRVLGLDTQATQSALKALLESGVLNKDPDTGVLFYASMVKQEDIRKKRQESGRKGGLSTQKEESIPVLLKQNSKQIPKQTSGNGNSFGNESVNGEESKPPESPPLDLRLKSRFGAMFRRRESTKWSDVEMKKLRSVEELGLPEDDIALLERWYGSKCTYLRRDLMAFLNNINGELDKAKEWFMKPETNGHAEPLNGFAAHKRKEVINARLSAIDGDFMAAVNDEPRRLSLRDEKKRLQAERDSLNGVGNHVNGHA